MCSSPLEYHRLLQTADASSRLNKYLITTRNRHVTTALESKYKDKLPDNELKVFCVDNIMYQEHRNSPRDAALPFLLLSGILDVRKHCIAMMANTQLRSARKYINNDIPALLGGIDLWVQSGAGTLDAERREVIRDTLNVLEARLNRVRHYFFHESVDLLIDFRNSQEMLRISIELQGSAKTCLERRLLEVCFLNASMLQLLTCTTGRRIEPWTASATRAGDVWAGVRIAIIPQEIYLLILIIISGLTVAFFPCDEWLNRTAS